MLFNEPQNKKNLHKESRNKELPVIILLHGGGLSSWSWQGVAVIHRWVRVVL